MNSTERKNNPSDARNPYADLVTTKANRKLRARKRQGTGLWFGIGMMGLVGWSVALPTVIGASIGLWLDKHSESDRSWTLALLVAGLCLGCFNAWRWGSKELETVQNESEVKASDE